MANFTPQEIEEILQQFFDVAGKRQYIGARYVPIFGRKGETSIEWDNSKPYEPLTIVTYQGNSYTSRTYVPVGVTIDNTDFWVVTGNYNAQIESYREDVERLQESFDDFQSDMEEEFQEQVASLEADYNSTKTSLTSEIRETEGQLVTQINTTETQLVTQINTTETQLVTQINTTESQMTAYINQQIESMRQTFLSTKYMVVIGDSFSNNSQSGTPLWYEIVAAQKGLTPYCNARDGRGFGAYLNHSDHTFLQQCQLAYAALPNDDVKLIYVVGGLNDTRNANYNYNEFQNGVRAVASYLVDNFPNAKIEMYGPQSFPQINRNTYDAALRMSWVCMTNGIEYHDLSGTFNLIPEFFGGNGGSGTQNSMHPSAKGEKIIASCILNHGKVKSPLYAPSTLPADLQQPPTLRQIWFYAPSDPQDPTSDKTWQQLPDSEIGGEELTTSDGVHFHWSLKFTGSNIPATANGLGFIVPFGYVNLSKKLGSDYPRGILSVIPENFMTNGWIDNGSSILTAFGQYILHFNINGPNQIAFPVTRARVEFDI